MQIIRTLIWIAILVAIVAFTLGNFDKATDVRIWPGLVWDTRVPAIVIVSFLAGLIPMWVYHRGVKWSLNRRIRSLESAVKSNALAQRHEPPKPAEPAVSEAETAPASDTLKPDTSKPGTDPA